jgi:crotonobetainyl-CoA:carnitine CoA-transferase CaiB-like acyl-CoA transferase
VFVSITGFGQTGPYRDHPGYDSVIQGMSGLMSITGQPDGPPTKAGVALSDVITGLFALGGLLAALRQAEHTGQGQHLDIALYDSQVAALVNIASSALISGSTPSRYGSAHPNIVPYQDFQASDGAFMVAVGNDGQFAALCRVIDQPELASDPRFSTNPSRVTHRRELIPTLQARFTRRTAAEWVEMLLSAGIPAGPIHSVTDALNDPHILARGLLHEVVLSSGDAVTLVGSPLLRGGVRLPPPALGQHTEEVLRELDGTLHGPAAGA